MDALDNLVKIKQLKKEPSDNQEVEGMLKGAVSKLVDSQLSGISQDGQFTLTYSAAHALALAALRLEGYRSDSRYMVFQCLQHTVNLPAEKWRIFDECHRRRNLAEYEGFLDIEETLLIELVLLTNELKELVLKKFKG